MHLFPWKIQVVPLMLAGPSLMPDHLLLLDPEWIPGLRLVKTLSQPFIGILLARCPVRWLLVPGSLPEKPVESPAYPREDCRLQRFR